MKKKLVLFMIMLLVTAAGTGVTLLFGNNQKIEEDFSIVTSFYPMYIATENIVDGIDGVTLTNMAENQGGCLHDYQMTTMDMRKLEHADVFILNGGGMESFIEDIVKRYPDIIIIDAGAGISLLEESSEHHHEEGGDEEENAHIWMNPEKYAVQVENITRGLSKVDTIHADQYEENQEKYEIEILKLIEDLKNMDVNRLSNGIVSFHDAFAYLAEILGIPVVHSVDLDNEASLSAGETAEIMEEMKENKVGYIFTAKQIISLIPERLEVETKVKNCVLDALVSGDNDKDAYIRGMRENIKTLGQVLADE